MKKSGWLRVWHLIGELLHIQHLLELVGLWALIVGPAGGIGVALLARAEALPLAIQIVLGLAALALVLAIGKSIRPNRAAQDGATAPAPTQQATATGTSNQALSAGGDIYYNQGPTETHRQPSAPKDSVIPNLRYAGFRKTVIHLDRYQRAGIREPTNPEEYKYAYHALLLRFENEPWSDGIGAKTGDLIAKAIYKCKPEPVKIGYCVWMESSLRSHCIDVGETDELLLLIRREQKTGEGDSGDRFMVMEDKRELNAHFSDPWSWFRPEVFSTVDAARITLTDQRSLTQYIFDFDIVESGERLSVELINSRLPSNQRMKLS